MIDAGRTSVLQIAERAWTDVRRECQLGPELGSRNIIGQVESVLSERFGISSSAALALLKRLAEQCDSSVGEVSRRLVKGAHPTSRQATHDVGRTAQILACDQDAELRRRLVREATRC